MLIRLLYFMPFWLRILSFSVIIFTAWFTVVRYFLKKRGRQHLRQDTFLLTIIPVASILTFILLAEYETRDSSSFSLLSIIFQPLANATLFLDSKGIVLDQISFAFLAAAYLGLLLFIPTSILWTVARRKKFLEDYGLMLAGSFIVILIYIAGLFYYYLTVETTARNSLLNMHMFNAHLKSLCVENKEATMCPRNEDELRAFRPKEYRQITKFSKTHYFFNESTKEYTWVIEGKFHTYVFKGEHYPVGYLMLPANDTSWKTNQ